MFSFRAAKKRAGVPQALHSTTLSRLLPALLSSLAIALSVALAQSVPMVGLDAFDYEVGDVLHLTGDNLGPGDAYRVSVGPVGSAPLVSVERADASGSISYSTSLEAPGDHIVHVEGPGLNASFTVSVAPKAGQSGTPPPVRTPEQSQEPSSTEPSQQPGSPGTSQPPAVTGEPGTPEQPGAAPQGPVPTPPASAEPNSQEPGDQGAQGTPGSVPGSAASGAYPTAQLVDGSVEGVRGGETVWSLSFPPRSGETAGLLQKGLDVYVGHGNAVLLIDARTGVVQKRHRLPAQVSAISLSGGVPLVTLSYSNGAEGRAAILSTGPEDAEPFDVDPDLYGWLRNEAAVADPASRLQQDPTNPWLYLEAMRSAAPGSSEESKALEGAQSNAVTFYERAQLARELMRFSPPHREAAATAMYGAFDDFVARGYRPELLFDRDLAQAYGFPLDALESALGKGDMQAAAFWAERVYLLATPAVPETQAALREYSSYLRVDGQREAADQWLERSREGAGFGLASAIRKVALDVGRTGWYGVAALLVALLALYVALAAKYWRPQSLNLRRQSSKGGGARFFFLRYATFTERLVAVLLLIAAACLASLQGWARDGDTLPAAWGSGSLESVPALDALARMPEDGADMAFVRGYAEQTSGAEDPAAEAYRSVPNVAAAVNNLGVLLDDPSLFRRALDLEPGLPAAAFNLGQGSNPSRLMATFAPDMKALVVPDESRLRSAVAGSFQTALASVFTNPWQTLTGVAGVGLAQWLWLVVVVAFLLLTLVNVVMLVLPRPRVARNAPRTPLYHLLAILLPGTGQADELWGVLLSVPWAIFGVDLLLHYMPLGVGPAMGLMTDLIALGVIYLVNLVAFLVEFGSYQRRMRALRANDPETARAYGMKAG
ncbi:MAG: hypothetical protein ROY82_09175 [Truepera sp.]|jgi:hypothetical protein|nr:hypothetical protein [Truepera sp.]